jgi:hypothetical protein
MILPPPTAAKTLARGLLQEDRAMKLLMGGAGRAGPGRAPAVSEPKPRLLPTQQMPEAQGLD